MTNYKKDTLEAYCSPKRAEAYKKYHTSAWSWGRLVTWLEQRALYKELVKYDWKPGDTLLDIPCGTGVLGRVLHHFPFKILASDISPEMMELAKSEYPIERKVKFLKADITATPFPRNSFSCIVTLGFLHRVPADIKRATLRELAALSKGIVIISCSIDTPFQRFKHRILSCALTHHQPALCPSTLEEISKECQAAGLTVLRAIHVLPFLSSHAILVVKNLTELEKG